jgi:hypothetical protein
MPLIGILTAFGILRSATADHGGWELLEVAPTKVTFSRGTNFHLPVEMSDATRTHFRELKLFVKIDGGKWQLHESLPPDGERFTYKAPHDGFFEFAFVTVDKDGRLLPDLSNGVFSSEINVMVDTKPPVIEAAVRTHEGKSVLFGRIIDEHIDLSTIRVTIRANKKGRVIEPQMAEFEIPLFDTEAASTIRIYAQDRCRLYAEKVLKLKGGPVEK